MKRVAMFLAGALGVVAVAMLLPTNVFAVCPPTANQTIDLCSGGGEVVYSSGDAGLLSGKFWVQGLGNDAADTGADSGIYSDAAFDGNFGEAPLGDLGIPDSRCLGWDWGSSGTDGCPDGSTRVWVVVSDRANRGFVASAAGFGAPSATWIFDFSFVDNGVPAPNFGGSANGLQLGRAVHVNSSSTTAGIVTVDVAALGIPNYGAGGGASLPGTVRLRGQNAGDVIQAGAGAHSIGVQEDSDLCWEIVDGSLTATLGCVHVGGLTPSQNLQNAKASLGRGQMNFSWEVSAQFDVLGFNVIQKNATKNTEQKVNDALIPIKGMNDAQAASYSFSAGRKDLKATRGGFEIEMVRLNGETSRTPAPLR